MRRQKTVSIGDVFNDFIKENGLEEGLQRIKVFEAWEIVVGKSRALYTEEKYFNKGSLICKISSASVRNSLFMDRLIIREKMNSILDGEVVKFIVLR